MSKTIRGRVRYKSVDALVDDMEEARKRLIDTAPDLLAALLKAQQDINWMLNNRQFLNPECFDYIEATLSKAKGEQTK